MFFKHRKLIQKETRVDLSSADLIDEFSDAYISEYFDKLKPLFPKAGEICKSVKICRTSGGGNNEAYTVKIQQSGTVIETSSARGAIYALADIKDMVLSREAVAECTFSDMPDCGFRAYRVFLPSRKKLEEFFDMARFLSDYKYNTFIIELGGAMEYKSRPEINAAWRKFAEDMRRYSGRSLEVQNAYAWEKDSIHADNAEGEILTQAEVKYIFDRLKAMHFDVIPEVPLLSHADYICLAYPELAERVDDPYPDTYCPSNPRTYEVVFDILDEVVRLLEPETVHIGHDEFYSMALCGRCKTKDPVDIYTDDIIKLYRYLKARNIKTMMWAEKLLNARRNGDEKIGGAGVDRINEAGFHVTVPPLYSCAAKLPKDILMVNWYWEFGAELDKTYTDNGFWFVYGNLYGADIDRWRERINGGVQGGAVSNWGGFEAKSMQHNLQWYALGTAAYMFWSDTYDSRNREALIDRVAETLYKRYRESIPENERIEIEHSVTAFRPHTFFYDGIFSSPDDFLGQYKLIYKDGEAAYLDVEYGLNISGENIKKGSREYSQTIYTALPVQSGGKTAYRTVYRNPHPEKEIKEITFVPKKEGGEMPKYRVLKVGGEIL